MYLSVRKSLNDQKKWLSWTMLVQLWRRCLSPEFLGSVAFGKLKCEIAEYVFCVKSKSRRIEALFAKFVCLSSTAFVHAQLAGFGVARFFHANPFGTKDRLRRTEQVDDDKFSVALVHVTTGLNLAGFSRGKQPNQFIVQPRTKRWVNTGKFRARGEFSRI